LAERVGSPPVILTLDPLWSQSPGAEKTRCALWWMDAFLRLIFGYYEMVFGSASDAFSRLKGKEREKVKREGKEKKKFANFCQFANFSSVIYVCSGAASPKEIL
jgi:hypothetical protein